MVEEDGKTDAERAAEIASQARALDAAPGGEVVTTAVVSGVALGDGLKLLTVEQGFEVLIEWKSSLHVYGSEEHLIKATAFYGSSELKDEKRFWREMGEAVRLAHTLKAELEVFLSASTRFPKAGLW